MKKIYSLLFFVLLILTSCKDNNNEVVNKQTRTVLVYMSANNNLYSYAVNNINEMERRWDPSFQGKLLVYLNSRDKNIPARLYEIQQGSTDAIESKIIKEYGLNHNDCDPKVMSEIIADTRSLATANNYGIIYWSHATGWLPQGMPPTKSLISEVQKNTTTSYSFGYNETFRTEINIYDMANALPAEVLFDFIIFDACHMASIESSYQLRKNTKYIVASAAETPARGLNYELILADLFEPEANLKSMINHTYDYYQSLTFWQQTCTLSLTDCSKLEPLATSLRNVLASPATNQPKLYDIQQFGRNATNMGNVFFDLEDFINKCWTNSAALGQFHSALSQAIPLKVNTETILGEIYVKTFCGITSYIPFSDKPEALKIYRTKFDWSKDSGLDKIAF